MKVKRLVLTAYGAALAVISASLLPFPVWVAFVRFGYYSLMFTAFFVASLQFLLNFDLLVSNLVTIPLPLFLTIELTYEGAGIAAICWLLGLLFNRWLLRHRPWFRSVL